MLVVLTCCQENYPQATGDSYCNINALPDLPVGVVDIIKLHLLSVGTL